MQRVVGMLLKNFLHFSVCFGFLLYFYKIFLHSTEGIIYLYTIRKKQYTI